mmetsp:Transcript_16338/g.46477  ORF Transcript_16338/g.46477 Transcript_16338/m.46477 type:complete len:206 (-) Transcript_16338:336-953(-)
MAVGRIELHASDILEADTEDFSVFGEKDLPLSPEQTAADHRTGRPRMALVPANAVASGVEEFAVVSVITVAKRVPSHLPCSVIVWRHHSDRDSAVLARIHNLHLKVAHVGGNRPGVTRVQHRYRQTTACRPVGRRDVVVLEGAVRSQSGWQRAVHGVWTPLDYHALVDGLPAAAGRELCVCLERKLPIAQRVPHDIMLRHCLERT